MPVLEDLVQAHESCLKQGGFAHPAMSTFALRF
jgi:hypothetical protein